MAITSEQVNQLISTQAAAMQQAHINAVRAGGGWASQLSAQGPDGDQVGSAIPSLAASAGSYVGNLPNAVTPAVTLAAGFGLLPRVLDPFTQSLSIGNVAAKAGGGWMGGGLAAGIGAAAVPFAAYTAAETAINHLALDPFKTGAQMRGATLGAIQSYMPGSPMSAMGATAEMMESMQRNKQFTMQDTMGLMSLGVAGGSINTNNMGAFQSSFKSLINETQQVAQALSSSLSEAYGAMQQIKGLGVSSASGTAYAMRGLGVAGGIAPAEMMGIAQGGASLAKMAGISRDVGVAGAMTSAATFGMVGASGALGRDFGIDDLGMAQNAGYRFFGSRQGSSVVAAMMSESGEFDSTMAARIAQGTVSKAEINRLANINRNKRPGLLAENSTEIVAQFMSEYGPQGISAPLTTMTRGMAHPGAAQMQLSGLNQEQLGELSALSLNSGSIKAQLSQAAQEGFNQGTRNMGLSEMLQKSMAKMTAPIRDKFQQMGASVAQAVAETVDDATRGFMGRPSLQSDMTGAQAIRAHSTAGNFTAARNVEHSLNSVANASFQLPSQAGFYEGLLPGGLTAEAHGQITGNMASNGWQAPSASYPGMMSIQAGAMLAGQSGMTAAAGQGMGALGGAMMNIAGKGGFMGSRQALAFAALGGRAAQATGWGLMKAATIGSGVGAVATLAGEGLGYGVTMWGRDYAGTDMADADTSLFGEAVAFERDLAGGQYGQLGEGDIDIAGTSRRRGSSGITRGYKTSKAEMRATAERHRANAPQYAAQRDKALASVSTGTKHYVEKTDSDTSLTMTQKAMRIGKAIGVSTEEGHNIALAGPTNSYGTATENQYVAAADAWFDNKATTKGKWWKPDGEVLGYRMGFDLAVEQGSPSTFSGKMDAKWNSWFGNRHIGMEVASLTSDADADAAAWGKTNRANIVNAAGTLIKSGKHSDLTSEAFMTDLDDAVVAGAPMGERDIAIRAASLMRREGVLQMLTFQSAIPMKAGVVKEINAGRKAGAATDQATKRFLSYAGTSSGINSSALIEGHDKFLAAHASSSDQRELALNAALSMADQSSEAQSIFAAKLADDPSAYGQMVSGTVAIQARAKSLDEAYLDGNKSSGRQWVEQFLGIQLEGTGVDKHLMNANNITPEVTRRRIREGVERIMAVQHDMHPSQFSDAQKSTVALTTQKIIDHAREKGTSSTAQIVKALAPMGTNAAPVKSDGQQAMMMKKLEDVVTGLTTQLESLSRKLPQKSE